MRYILNTDLEQIILATRAARWLDKRPDKREAILTFGEPAEATFYVRRNKASISVFQEAKRVDGN